MNYNFDKLCDSYFIDLDDARHDVKIHGEEHMNADESLELVDFIFELKKKFPITILMIEHHMDVVTNLCDACTVLNFGKTLAVGTVDEIKRNPKVIEAYLGGDE